MSPMRKPGMYRLKITKRNAAARGWFAVYLGCVYVKAFLSSNCRIMSPAAGAYTAKKPAGLSSSTACRIAMTPSGAPAGDNPTKVDEDEGVAPMSRVWRWRNGWDVHYERAGGSRWGGAKGHGKSAGQQPEKGFMPLLLLPGFGVGTFHFRRNMQELSKTHDVYSLDFLGQGKSWPTRAPTREDGLCYSVDTWTEQVLAFIDEVIGEPVYVAGNSLGGFIATNLAANYPRAVRGLVLLNATPFWAFRKPIVTAAARRGNADASAGVSSFSSSTEDVSSGSPNSAAAPTASEIVPGNATEKEGSLVDGGGDWLGWDGTLPAPAGLFRFGAWYFDRMRDPRTVKSMLGAVYSNPEAVGDEVVSEIIAATERGPSNHDYGVGGHEAFTSIVFSPKASMTFEEMIDGIRVPMALIYGKEDPWVVPLWGHRIKRQRPETLYYEVSPSGHCPHHESPKTVNALLADWLKYASAGGTPPLSRDGKVLEMQEDTGTEVRATLVPDARPRGLMEWLDSAVWSITTGRISQAYRQ